MIYINKNILTEFTTDAWQEVVTRLNYPLLNSFLRIGVLLKNKDLEFDNSLQYQLLLNPKIYVLKSDIKKLDGIIKKNVKENVEFVSNYLNYLEKHCQTYIKLIGTLNKESKKDLEQNELLELFIKYKDATNKIISHIYPPLSLEKCILEKVKRSVMLCATLKNESKELKDLIQQLIEPEQISTVMQRELSILKLSIKFQLREINKSNKVVINEYNKYKWLLDHTWDMAEESLSDFLIAIKKAKKQNPEKKIDDLKNSQALVRKRKKYLIQKYQLDNNTISLVKSASRLPTLRALRLEVILQSRHVLNETLFKKISQIIKFPSINQCYYWEIEEALKNKGFDKKLIKLRTLKHSFLASKKGVYILNDIERKKLENKIIKKIVKVNEIKGTTASLGYARGVIRVIANKSEYNDFKEGEILVTSMTTPDFVPLMKKSAAIITDEGGISCHAAIVSRELHKPCIIGTKSATKMLKDGDTVEVDADNGIIRII